MESDIVERLSVLGNAIGVEQDRGKIGLYIDTCKEAAAEIVMLRKALARRGAASDDRRLGRIQGLREAADIQPMEYAGPVIRDKIRARADELEKEKP